jgi:hypothetical protein
VRAAEAGEYAEGLDRRLRDEREPEEGGGEEGVGRRERGEDGPRVAQRHVRGWERERGEAAEHAGEEEGRGLRREGEADDERVEVGRGRRGGDGVGEQRDQRRGREEREVERRRGRGRWGAEMRERAWRGEVHHAGGAASGMVPRGRGDTRRLRNQNGRFVVGPGSGTGHECSTAASACLMNDQWADLPGP